jgi:hypothetical protein
MGVFVKHEPCPKCGSRDNLGRYADGSAWCFGCGHIEGRDRIAIRKEKEYVDIQLDDDLCSDFPGHVVGWLARYDVSIQEALKHGWQYAPKRDQLVFIFRDDQGTPILTQARNFWSGAKVKYFTQGPVADVLPIFRTNKLRSEDRTLVVVEDVVSAAKIARQSDAMPCLGSHLPRQKLTRLKPFYDVLYVWLDADKLNEARDIAQQAKWLGFDTRVVYTPLDPKEYSDGEIADAIRL